MKRVEGWLAAGWGANVASIFAMNPHDWGHCLCVLMLYTAVFFLYLAPFHALLAGAAWLSRRAAGEPSWLVVATRWVAAESVVYWVVYWGMMLQLVPLNLRAL